MQRAEKSASGLNPASQHEWLLLSYWTWANAVAIDVGVRHGAKARGGDDNSRWRTANYSLAGTRKIIRISPRSGADAEGSIWQDGLRTEERADPVSVSKFSGLKLRHTDGLAAERSFRVG